MNNYIKVNEDRWNNVKNDYTEPLTHEELEEVRNSKNKKNYSKQLLNEYGFKLEEYRK